jgi:hypothetical protein
MDVNVTPFEIETKTRHGDMVRADVYLPRNSVRFREGCETAKIVNGSVVRPLRNLPETSHRSYDSCGGGTANTRSR